MSMEMMAVKRVYGVGKGVREKSLICSCSVDVIKMFSQQIKKFMAKISTNFPLSGGKKLIKNNGGILANILGFKIVNFVVVVY